MFQAGRVLLRVRLPVGAQTNFRFFLGSPATLDKISVSWNFVAAATDDWEGYKIRRTSKHFQFLVLGPSTSFKAPRDSIPGKYSEAEISEIWEVSLSQRQVQVSRLRDVVGRCTS